jgi:hypothetical protein
LVCVPYFHYEIKANPKTARKASRNTFAKQIRTTALQDVEKAWLFARRGRQFSEIEEILHSYYFFYEQLQNTIATGKPSVVYELWEKVRMIKLSPQAELEALERFCGRENLKITRIFIDAVKNRDSKKIMEIAHAVEFFKFFDIETAGDRYRSGILANKKILDKYGEKMTLRKLAEKIEWPQSNSADGLSQLRRICRELNFPLAQSRKIRKK